MELLEKNKGKIIKNLEISTQDSEAIFIQAVKYQKNLPLAKLILAHFYVHGIYPVNKNLHLAKNYLRQAGNDGSHEAFRYLGILYDFLGDDKYEWYLNEATRMGNKESNPELIEILMRRKRWKRAIERLDAEGDIKGKDLLIKKAVCYYQINEHSKAFDIWRNWVLTNYDKNPLDLVTKYIQDNGFVTNYFMTMAELREERMPVWRKIQIITKSWKRST